MPKKKTKVLCTIPLPMPMDDFVDVTKTLNDAFTKQGRKTFIRNGTMCYEIFEFVEESNGGDEDDDAKAVIPTGPA